VSANPSALDQVLSGMVGKGGSDLAVQDMLEATMHSGIWKNLHQSTVDCLYKILSSNPAQATIDHLLASSLFQTTGKIPDNHIDFDPVSWVNGLPPNQTLSDEADANLLSWLKEPVSLPEPTTLLAQWGSASGVVDMSAAEAVQQFPDWGLNALSQFSSDDQQVDAFRQYLGNTGQDETAMLASLCRQGGKAESVLAGFTRDFQ